jgi:hypothetical protein
MTVHVFSKGTPGNFPSASVDSPRLYVQIFSGAGLQNLIKIEVGNPTGSADSVVITFSAPLTGTQPTQLSGVINSHSGAITGSETGLRLSGAILGYFFQDERVPGYREIKSELSGVTSPNATDDVGKGFTIGSEWFNILTKREFVLTDSTVSGAIWKETTLSGSGTSNHSDLSGLGNDDHIQYLLTSGSRPMSGTLDLGGNDIKSVKHLYVSGNVSVTGTINGNRHYGSSASDPTTPPPSEGDHYYNTVIHEEMRYDSSRSKWLSINSMTLTGGRNGATAAGGFYRASDGMVMDNANRGYRIPKGTLIFASMNRTDLDSAVLEVLVSGSIIASLSSSTFSTASNDLNSDFDEGVISFRNKAGLNGTTNVQIVVNFKKRV